jgi:D-beta-D-heptose 7-phosphate kinase/D-beta-D-heptose 1-phosphate adenosyltransferase
MHERDLSKLIDDLGRPRVLIVGDLILDRYVSGDVGRISPEAPIPILRARRSEERLGGAGNVAANLRAMEAEVEVLGVVGEDGLGERLRALLGAIGVDAAGAIRSADRPTTDKTRMMSGIHQMLRVDWEDAKALAGDAQRALLARLAERIPHASAVILSDYGKGVLTEEVVASVLRAARRRGVPVLVDPKGRDYSRYRGATLVTPNRKEAEEALGRSLADLDQVARAARELIELADLAAAVITLGPDGMHWCERSGASGRVPAMARAVFDVTGAGDTAIAHLALALADGRSVAQAVELANRAAGIVVGKRGAAAVTRAELRAALGEGRGGPSSVFAREDLPRLLAEWRAEGRRIVLTNGCFDILHRGHVEYLRFARSRGDALLVAVNDDASVRRLKGAGRPVNSLEDRLAVLAALEMVDAVVGFGEDTPERLVREVTPDVLVKGEDWATQGVVGREWVEAHGGEVQLAPLLEGRSTSAILARLAGDVATRAHAEPAKPEKPEKPAKKGRERRAPR